MKLLALSLMLLWLVGCSHDMSTSPLSDSESADVAALSNAATTVDPVNDIEPPVPVCEVNHTGFVELTNTGTRTVTCCFNGTTSFDVLAGQTIRREIPMGAYDVTWRLGEYTCYTTEQILPQCKTLKLKYEPKLAVRVEHMQ